MRKMEKLLLLGKAQACVEIIEYAKSQGVYTIITATEDVEHCVAKKYADECWSYSTADLDTLEKKCKENNITSIFCGISEFNIDRMIELGERLNLPVYCTAEAWSYSRDKLKFRTLCESIGAPMAKYYHVTKDFLPEDLKKVVYPVVVKPVDRNGNRGISFCYNEEELIEGYKAALSVSNSEKIVVERMLKGREYGAFYVMADGEVHLLSFEAMCNQPGYPYNCYCFETTATNQLDHFLQELNPKLKEVMKAVGCKDGVAWVELILDEDGHFYILEMGHRMNGEMMFKAFPKTYNFNIIKWMTDIARGIKHTKEDLPKELCVRSPYSANVYAVWTKKEGTIKEIVGLDKVLEQKDTYCSFASYVGDTVGQYRHIGTVIFNSESTEKTKETINRINELLSVIDEEGNNIMIQFNDFSCLGSI